MARGFSKAIITGNIVRDPEMRTTPSGATVCGFTVAVNRLYKDSSGNNQESVSFIDCSAWGKAGEIIAQHAKKGSGILVSGRLDQRSWEDKDTKQKRSRVEVVVEDFNFLGSGQGGNGGSGNSGSTDLVSSEYDTPSKSDIDDINIDEPIDLSEIPF
jgi:single-strand DNA-binding protein